MWKSKWCENSLLRRLHWSWWLREIVHIYSPLIKRFKYQQYSYIYILGRWQVLHSDGISMLVDVIILPVIPFNPLYEHTMIFTNYINCFGISAEQRVKLEENDDDDIIVLLVFIHVLLQTLASYPLCSLLCLDQREKQPGTNIWHSFISNWFALTCCSITISWAQVHRLHP